MQGRDVRIKILGDGELTQEARGAAPTRFSKSALAKIEKAGGKAVVIAATKPTSEESAS